MLTYTHCIMLGVSGAEYMKIWANPRSGSKLTKLTGLASRGRLAKAAW